MQYTRERRESGLQLRRRNTRSLLFISDAQKQGRFWENQGALFLEFSNPCAWNTSNACDVLNISMILIQNECDLLNIEIIISHISCELLEWRWLIGQCSSSGHGIPASGFHPHHREADHLFYRHPANKAQVIDYLRLSVFTAASFTKPIIMAEQIKRNDVLTVVVIGAGILGLTSAIKIQEAIAAHKADVGGHLQVLLVSREWPSSIPGSPSKHSPNYASMWAGAHVRPIPATTAQLRREAEWLKQTVAEFSTQLQTEPWSGITRTLGIELLEAPDDGYQKQDAKSFTEETGLLRYRKWSEAELPENVVLGYEYETYCVNTPIYCQSLLRRFILRGGRTLKRDLKTEWEAFGLQKNVVLVVNASGTGFGDPKYFPTRGQTVVTDMEDATKTVTRQHKDGTWSFIIPRFFSGGTIVGGTKQPGDWSAEPDANTRATLLAGGRELRQFASSLAGKSDDVSVIADVVGRRPTREGGMRIELERQPVSGRQAAVLHAYGAGGRGYEIGWGVANEVAQLVNKFLIEESPLASKL
ncbi:D-amino-acid oxidase [Beauveria bassiana]|nr:D-amino-acid oxidase [Beauveria bassiana]KAH8713269.1 D-amino-acid oxidase [Beauveria bassiana]